MTTAPTQPAAKSASMRDPLSFKGRMSSTSYLLVVLTFIIIQLLCTLFPQVIDAILSVEKFEANPEVYGIFMMAVIALVLPALLLFFFACTWRRLHDFNTFGWLALLLIPVFKYDPTTFVSLLLPIVIGLIPGTKGENKYGPETA